MTAPKTQNKGVITAEDLSSLPQIVQQYLRYSGVIGKPMINTVSLKYKGKFRLGATKPWMNLRVKQVYTVDPPGFQWKASFKRFGFPLMVGEDTFYNGKGRMFGKLLGLFTIFDEQDDKLLQGTMIRYLQEMLWFPTAYLAEYVTWRGIDDFTAEATFTWADKQVTGCFHFDELGRPLSFVGQRHNSERDDYLPWSTPMTAYKSIAGLNLPTRGCGIWEYPEGDFTYINMQLTELQYDIPIAQFSL